MKKQPCVKSETDKKLCKEEICHVAPVVEPPKEAEAPSAVTDDYMVIDDSDDELPAT